MSTWNNLSIRVKLIAAFLLTSILVLGINLFLYANINTVTGKIDMVYESNSKMNELSETLTEVQDNLTKFLNDKSSETLDAYYRGVQNLNELIGELNQEVYGDQVFIMERNIYNMVTKYLEHTEEAVSGKRGRNVEKYRVSYQEALESYGMIQPYISTLNNIHFKGNAESYEVLSDYLKYFELMSTFILVVVSFGVIVLILILTQNIIGPLKELAEAANEVARGNLQVERVEVTSMDELGIVSSAFNQMVENIREYIEKIRKNMEIETAMKEKELIMQGHLKDAQLKYLQAQINPHFLFNTLNAGAQLAMLEGANKTCTFVENMANFFRYNVKKINEDASLQEELELVDNYLYILNVRFSGEIHFKKEIETEWLQVRVPSMILQPIVENAVNYGIREIEWEGLITLRVYENASQICISISDNGIGIKKEKIEMILKGEIEETDLSKNSTGIGLGNVISRLQVYYNQEKVIHIHSEGENKGTEVILYIPKPVE